MADIATAASASLDARWLTTPSPLGILDWRYPVMTQNQASSTLDCKAGFGFVDMNTPVKREFMPGAEAFNAAEWIARNARGGIELRPEAQHAVASFTTMWNFFESTLCENRASVAAFERICDDFELDRLQVHTAQVLDECLAFWALRYRTPEGFGLTCPAFSRRSFLEDGRLG